MERRVVDHLAANGFPWAERRAMEGMNDRGDVSGIPGFCCEVKNTKTMNLAGWMDELYVEMKNARASIGAVVFPRRNHAIGKAYALMDLDMLINLIGDDLILGRVRVPDGTEDEGGHDG